MRFAKEFPDELRMQVAVSDVISKKVSLKKRGKDHLGLCPFHNEKTPSFTVNDQKGFYHCFGCSAHGDIISFVMEIEGLDFKESVIKLANDYGITIPFIKEKQDDDYQKKQDRKYLILEKTCQFFEKNLLQHESKNALDYLLHRGLSKKDIAEFRLGFAKDNFESLIEFLKKEGFAEFEMLGSGSVSKNGNGNLYDKFRNRIIFPIFDKRGKVIAFGGRILGDGQPKYLNSPETELFKKGQNLYNYSRARSAIYNQKFVCIVEGYMDVIALAVRGIGNSVAPLGTAITIDQIKELFRITNDVVICLDGDEAGVKAMRRVIDMSLAIIDSEHIIRFAFLPNKSDPDDFIKANGAHLMMDLLNNAQNLSQTLFEYEAKDLGIVDFESKIAPEKKAQLESRLFSKINLIADVNSKKYFSQYYRNSLFEIGRKKFLKNNVNTSFVSKNRIIIDEVDLARIYADNILLILVQYPKLVDYQDQYYNIREFLFEDEGLTNLKELIIDFIDDHEDYTLDDIKAYLDKSFHDINLKKKILNVNESDYSLDGARIRLELLILKYHHYQVSKQYEQTLIEIDDLDTDEKSIKQGKQREIFDHKTFLEKKILRLESDIT